MTKEETSDILSGNTDTGVTKEETSDVLSGNSDNGVTKEKLEGLRSVPVQRARKINYHKTGACCLNIITYCCDAKYSRK